MSNKKLVAYFSASGVTKKVAKTLAEAAKADLFEIKPAVPYTVADLDWMDKNSRSSREMNDLSFRPEVASKLEKYRRLRYNILRISNLVVCSTNYYQHIPRKL